MLIHHFMDAESDERIPFTPRTGWTPGEDKVPREITEFITGTAWAIRDMPTTKDTPNLTRKEMDAMAELRDNNELVIEPAGKGSSIVIMDKNLLSMYVFEAHRQLNKIEHYTKLHEPIYKETQKEIEDILEDCNNQNGFREKRTTVTNPCPAKNH